MTLTGSSGNIVVFPTPNRQSVHPGSLKDPDPSTSTGTSAHHGSTPHGAVCSPVATLPRPQGISTKTRIPRTDFFTYVWFFFCQGTSSEEAEERQGAAGGGLN